MFSEFNFVNRLTPELLIPVALRRNSEPLGNQENVDLNLLVQSQTDDMTSNEGDDTWDGAPLDVLEERQEQIMK